MTITIAHYLVLAAVLFSISVAGIFLNRRNLILLLMCIELMLLAVNFNFVAFSRMLGDPTGQVFVFFILTVAAAESAIGLAILLQNDLDLVQPLAVDNLAAHPGIGQPLGRGLPLDQLTVERRQRRRAGRQEVDRLEQARFALGVGAVEEQRLPGQFEFQARVVTEVGQAERAQVHTDYRLAISTGSTGSARGKPNRRE